MKNNRIDYIDKLKGIAIIFMVIGHVMQISLGVGSVAFNKFYTSFHMPIFMFLSGLFVYKYFNEWSFAEYKRFIMIKVKRILLPFFVVGGLFSYVFYGNITCLLDGSFNGYWFLPALFFLMCIDVSLAFVLKNFKRSFVVDILIRLLVWLFLIILYQYGLKYAYFRGAVYHYPFFIMGILMVKYDWLKKQVFYNSNAIAVQLLAYLTIWVFVEKVPFGFNLLGVFSIPILFFLFDKLNSQISIFFSLCGAYSLEIYVFHRFFLPSLLEIGTYLTTIITEFDKSQNFILFLLLSLFISIPICVICIWMGKSIKEITLLNKIIFGK